MNAQIKSWLEWLEFYNDRLTEGLTEFKIIKLNISDLTTEQLKDVVINYDFKLIHTRLKTSYDEYETESKIVYKVLRDKTEHEEHEQDCKDSYLYWIIKLNKTLNKEPKYKEEVKSYLECYKLNYPELDL